MLSLDNDKCFLNVRKMTAQYEYVYQIKEESYYPLKGSYVNTPFRVDETLEQNDETKGKRCLETFIAKGGQFHHLDPNRVDRFVLFPNDIVYPSCSAGYNRSQTLFVILSNFSITLFAPHATRLGFDPYNDKANWHVNKEKDKEADGFAKWANRERETRFGFDHFKYLFDENPSIETLREIRKYFDDHYFGPSIGNEMKDRRRVYITFAQNAHVIIHRLNQTNEELNHVVVVSIDLDDYIGKPLDANVGSNSEIAFAIFSQILMRLIDVTQLIKSDK